MVASQVERQFCRLREVPGLVYGRRTGSKNGGKLTASTRVGSQSRLMNYLVYTKEEGISAKDIHPQSKHQPG